jgi:hypothetical protein
MTPHRQDLAGVVDHPPEIAVIEVRNHVARLGNAERFGCKQMLGVLHLELANVHVERKVEDLREPLGELQRAGAVVADCVAFDVTQHVAMFFGEVDPLGDRHVAERAHVALDEV